MAKKELFSFLSKDGKTQIHAVSWKPESGEYKAVLQIVHGMIEYIERYEPFAEYMTEHGYLVVGHDHLGHGESVQSKEDWGYFAPNPSDTLVSDIHTMRTIVQKENPGKPYFIMGHSMGSYMTRKYLSVYGTGLDGVIIMGTGYVPGKKAKFGIQVTSLLEKIRGERYHSKLVTSLTFDKPYKKYDLNGKDDKNSWLTKDSEVVKEYYSNPKCTFTFSVNAYKGLFEAVYFDDQPENIEKIPKDLSIFMVSGEDDPVGNFGEGVKHVYDTYKHVGIKDITWKLYKNDRHEILNETDKEVVYHDILAWLNVHIV